MLVARHAIPHSRYDPHGRGWFLPLSPLRAAESASFGPLAPITQKASKNRPGFFFGMVMVAVSPATPDRLENLELALYSEAT